MKTRLMLLLTALCVSISSCYDDTALRLQVEDHEQRIAALETICNQMNTNINSLKVIVEALQNNDCITGIVPISEGGEEVGYTITFKKASPITIYHGKDGQDGADGKDGKDGADGKDGVNGIDGKDGSTPVIGVRMDADGIYYWTLNGDWLYDDAGNKIQAIGQNGKDGEDGQDGKDGVDGTDGKDGEDGEDGQDGEDGEDGVDGADGKDGITPMLKIEDGYWYVSYDNGGSWKQLGIAEIKTDDSSFFNDVTISETSVSFTLADGQTFVVPVYQPIGIAFDIDDNEAVVLAGETIVIRYTLENASADTFVTAGSDGNYKVRIKPDGNKGGVIEVDCPDPYVDGFINVIVSDGRGYSIVKAISFCEKEMTFSNGYEYSVPAVGGDVYIPFTINFDYHVEVCNDAKAWVSVAETKAESRPGSISLKVSRNDETSARKGTINVYAENNPDAPYCQLTINQASAIISIGKTTFVSNSKGETFSTEIVSSRGLSIDPDSLPEWVSVNYEAKADDMTYDVEIVLDENTGEDKRFGEITCCADDGKTVLGTLTVVQLGSNSNDKKDMVLRVRVNFANDFTCELPIFSSLIHDVDCYIDWGDGTIEHYKQSTNGVDYSFLPSVKHTYENLSEGTTFEVRISGIVEKLGDYYVDDDMHPANLAITDVVQWGHTGLKSLSGAFCNNLQLKSIPADEDFSLAEVTSFDGCFSGCTSLVSIPNSLFANCIKATNFSYCFKDCDALTSIPDSLFANCNQATYFSYCFKDCDALTSIPDSLFANCNQATRFTDCFAECTSLISIPNSLFANCIKATYFSSCFSNCNALTSIPADLFAHCDQATDFSNCFSFCDALTSIPDGLFANCTKATNFSYCFNGCHDLQNIPISLFDNNRRITKLDGTFAGCISYNGESPYTVIDGIKYHLYERAYAPDHFVTPQAYSHCFSGSSKISDYDSIPSDWK